MAHSIAPIKKQLFVRANLPMARQSQIDAGAAPSTLCSLPEKKPYA